MKIQKVHFLGIGGSGASAVASIAQTQGYFVNGCDTNPKNEFTHRFDPKLLSVGHAKTHLKNIDLLAITPAIFYLDPKNEELAYAKKLGIPILTWQQFMGEYLQKDKFIIAVCGSHGKSTTTAMVGLMLEDSLLDPTVELGAIIPNWKTNFRAGRGGYFVTEADEFNDNFLSITPDISIVTNIDMDHPEYFSDFNSYKESFKKFLLKTKQLICANGSDWGVQEVLEEVLKKSSVLHIDYSENRVKLNLKVIGDFNLLNAKAAFTAGLNLGLDPGLIKKSLEGFAGIGRRFEYLGKLGSTSVYTDFAHHPTELKVTVESIRKLYPNQKILMVFQPHMFSRTKAFFDQFVQVLSNLDINQIIITDIYPSREIDKGEVKSQQLVSVIPSQSVSFVPKDKVLEKVKKIFYKFDIVLFVGAGDIDKIARVMLKK